MRNHKQILMKSEIFFKEPPMVCMNQECGGILIFLANSPLKFAWIIGIYGKPIFWTLGISKNPLTPSKYRFPPLHPISAPDAITIETTHAISKLRVQSITDHFRETLFSRSKKWEAAPVLNMIQPKAHGPPQGYRYSPKRIGLCGMARWGHKGPKLVKYIACQAPQTPLAWA